MTTNSSTGTIEQLRKLLAKWKEDLVSLDRRNRLVHCNPESRSVVEVASPSLAEIAEGLKDEGEWAFAWRDALAKAELPEDSKAPASREAYRLALGAADYDGTSELLVDVPDKTLFSRLRRLRDDGKTAASEQGITILYLAVGLLRWFESPHSDEEFLSPLALVPVKLERRGFDHSWFLSAADAVTENVALGLRMKDLGVEIPKPPEAPEDIPAYLDEVRSAVKKHADSRTEVLPKVVLGTFVFAKLAMYEDLNANEDAVLESLLVRLLGGDASAREEPSHLCSTNGVGDKTLRPHDLFTVKDCDHSQTKAVAYARDGMSLVIDGPPGTGKSQTITNIISDSLARGKTVLFVSEKVAALEVGKARLQEAGLGDYCLELHSHKQKRKEVLDELARCLGLAGELPTPDEAPLDRLEKARLTLNRYAESLHAKAEGEGWSLFGAYAELASVLDAPAISCDLGSFLALGVEGVRRQRDVLAEFAAHPKYIAARGRHPWEVLRGDSLTLSAREKLEKFFKQAQPLAVNVSEAAARLCPKESAGRPVTLDEVNAIVGFLEAESPKLFSVPSQWWSLPPDTLFDAVSRLAEDVGRCESLIGKADPASMRRVEVMTGEIDNLRGPLDDLVRGAPEVADSSLAKATEAIARNATSLQEAIRAATELLAQVDGMLADLGVPASHRESATVASAKGWCRLVTTVVDVGSIDPKLLQPAIRSEVIDCGRAYVPLKQMAENIRQQLVGRMLPGAFQPEGIAAARQAARFGWWWQRIFSSEWKPARDAMARFKAGGTADVAGLVADAQALTRWGNIVDQCNDCAQATPVRPRSDSRGQPDFDSLLRQIEVAQWGEQVGLSADEIDSLNAKIATASASYKESCRDIVDRIRIFQETLGRLPAAVEESGVTVRSAADQSLHRLSRDLTDTASGMAPLSEVFNRLVSEWPRLKDAPLRDLMPMVDAAIRVLQSHAVLAPANASDGRWPDDFLPAAEAVRRARLVAGDGIPPLFQAVLDRGQNGRRSDVELLVRDGAKLRRCCEEVTKALRTPSELGSYPQWPLNRIAGWMSSLTESMGDIEAYLAFRSAWHAARGTPLAPFMDSAISGKLSADQLLRAFDRAFFMQKADSLASARNLGNFDLVSHEKAIGEFRELDRTSPLVHQSRVRHLLARNATSGLVGMWSEETATLQAEAKKPKGRRKLRQVFADISSVLLALKPCVMMSPLSVSTFFDGGCEDLRFDLVVIDEASQVKPADAIAAIYRGRQLIVAGDDKQLPPTNFFQRLNQEEDEEDETEDAASPPVVAGVESVLDACVAAGIHRNRLLWHYRSRHESLIAFSNHHYYGNDLVTFPSTLSKGGVELHYVKDGRWIDQSNPPEAKRVVELVEEALLADPTSSIGIVTFNQSQQFLVEDELEKLRRKLEGEGVCQEVLDALGGTGREPVFVKNLENVQGDERDCIILSVAYANDKDGKFAMRFGPLNNEGGHRRLNVAITRARKRMLVVTSVRSDEFRVSSASPRGVQNLHAFIRFAEEGPSSFGATAGQQQGGYDSPFEESVAKALAEKGLNVVPQVGCSRFRIDLGVTHPKDPTRYVLGVECDGATYHRSAVARDRDRLRQEVLEGLGWTIVRVWSTDWVRNPSHQIDRIMKAYQSQLNEAEGKALSETKHEGSGDAQGGHSSQAILTSRPAAEPAGAAEDEPTELGWFPPGENPFGILLLDVRPFTRTMLSTTKDPSIAMSYLEQRDNDGRSLLGQPLAESVTVPCELSFDLPRPTKNGPLFKAECMEEKWDIYHHEGKLLFARSWTGELVYRASIKSKAKTLTLTTIETRGVQVAEAAQHVLFLVLSHLEGVDFPHTLPATISQDPEEMASASFSLFGRRASFATHADILKIKVDPNFGS